MYIVATGNPFDGQRITGPFEEFADAEEWANVNADLDWFIVELHLP